MWLGAVGTFGSAWTVAAFIICLGVVGYFQSKSEAAKSAKERVSDAKDQTSHWRDSFQAENTRANELSKQIEELREERHKALSDLAAERLRRDLTPLMTLCTESFKQMTDQFDQMTRRIDGVEDRLNSRMEAFLEVTQAQTVTLAAISHQLERTK